MPVASTYPFDLKEEIQVVYQLRDYKKRQYKRALIKLIAAMIVCLTIFVISITIIGCWAEHLELVEHLAFYDQRYAFKQGNFNLTIDGPDCPIIRWLPDWRPESSYIDFAGKIVGIIATRKLLQLLLRTIKCVKLKNTTETDAVKHVDETENNQAAQRFHESCMSKSTQSRVRQPRSKASSQPGPKPEDGTQVERPTNKQPPQKIPSKTTRDRATTSVVVTLLENKDTVRNFVKSTCELGVKGISEAFDKIRLETQPCTKPKTAHDSHTDRNRYKDVYCIDETRVILKYPEGANDYIHANWVRGPEGTNRYICTQGPTEKTIEDFWRMIWQEKPPVILMLCNLFELGRKKCEMYWPEQAETPLSLLNNQLTVKLTTPAVELEKSIILMKFTLTDTQSEKTHIVDHYQWKAWPDRGVPEVPMATFRLLAKVRKAHPVVVHCSAGIGRTGTIVGLEIAYDKYIKGEKITMEEIVRDIRSQRHGSVQTDAQYLFMHRVMLTLAENKETMQAEINTFITDYNKVMASKAG
ncbi:unnamed protein product [Caenorhabditis auriculariae]|uniref:Protein-tyrosine-phosphatase n=1 Tax=Caenorhabditis auriculariae TaxID=2777116 RepID=A0A8S1H707_9PELO|nr:unnamed protein product [Caenorhabditis auriculariae]